MENLLYKEESYNYPHPKALIEAISSKDFSIERRNERHIYLHPKALIERNHIISTRRL